MPPSLQPLSQKAIEVKQRFGTYEQFATKYNPNIQLTLKAKRMDYAECYRAKFPLLSHLGAAYTDESIILWLKIQLDNLNDFCGVKEKLKDDQIEELAYIIFYDYYFLNVAEVALFFSKYKLGHFGEFYGVVDPLKITSGMLAFQRERLKEITRVEREEETAAAEAAREQREKTAITREQYLLLKRQERLKQIKYHFKSFNSKNPWKPKKPKK